MKDKTGRVTIKGFYDSVVPLSEREQRALKAIPPFDDYLKQLYGFAQSESGDKKLIIDRLFWQRASADAHAGWLGPDLYFQ